MRPPPLSDPAIESSHEVLEERLGLIDAAIYADVYDCAVTAEELWRYSRVPMARREFRRRISEDPALGSVLRERDGLYCLVGRESLLDLRLPRRRRATQLHFRARLAARALQH
nr:hypothetical protein [Actinomycetota bacterium]